MARPCSRCGRTPRPEESGPGVPLERLLAEVAPEKGILFMGLAWGRVDGLDVCPDCLTPAEERSLAESFVQLVEREAKRLADSEAEPSPHEAALNAYAMRLRSELESIDPPPPPAEVRQAVTARDAWGHFEVALTGAFLTGAPLRVPIADYEQFQESLCGHLRERHGWGVNGVQWRDIETYGGGGGYRNLVPLVLLRRDGEDLKAQLEAAQHQRPEAELQWFHDALEGWGWELRSLRIEIYDLGVGTITGVYEVTVPDKTGVATAHRTLDAIGGLRRHSAIGGRSPVAESFEALTYATVREFSRAVRDIAPQARQEPWLASMLEALDGDPADNSAEQARIEESAEWGRLMWLHPVFVLTDHPDASVTRLDGVGQPFAPAFCGKIPYWHGLFMPGIDSSVIVLRAESQEGPNPPLHLTELMWAYYALFMEMDRGLLALLDNDRWRKPESLGALEQDAERMFDIYMRVQEARARLDSALTELAGGQLSIWRGMEEVQKFDELTSSVDAKVQLLQRVAERRVQEASAARAQRASRILGGLTALTVVTVAVALMGNFIGTSSIGIGIGWRVLIVALAFALAVFLYLQAQREIAQARRSQALRALRNRSS